MDDLFTTSTTSSDGEGSPDAADALFDTSGGAGGDAPAASGGHQSALDWLGDVDDEISRFVHAKGPKSPADLAKMYRQAEQRISKLSAEKGPPAPDASDEDWSAYYAKAGRPETPEGYRPPEGAEVDPALWGVVQKGFHAAGISPRQSPKLLETYNAVVTAAQEHVAQQSQAKRVEFLQSVERERGADGARAFAASVKAGAAELGWSADLVSTAGAAGGWGQVMSGLARIGSMVAADSGPPAGAMGSKGAGMTPEQIIRDPNLSAADKSRLFQRFHNDKFL